MHVSLGTFAATSIAAICGGEISIGVERALRHYCRRLESSQPPLPVPRFGPPIGPRKLVIFTLDAALELRLRREVARQGVGLGELVRHAVLTYVADADAGLVAFG